MDDLGFVELASLANKTPLHRFIDSFPCLPAPPRPNNFVKFRLADASKPPLTKSPSPLIPSAWASLLCHYPGGLKIHLPMILRFGAELGYQGPPDAFILSKNLSSALEDPAIIDKKLTEDLALGRVVEVESPTPPFICSPLGLVPKHDGGWRRIHHLFYPRGSLVNDYIPDGAGELRYTRFQEVLQLVIQAGRNCIILKRDVKDAFRNVPVAPQHQWLLGFTWWKKFYKETCLSFGLATAPCIFNLFAEALHWLIVSFLHWTLCHYLDDFIAIFKASKASTEQIKIEAKAYIWLTDLLGIPRNDSKDRDGTEVVVFGIEIDTSSLTARLPKEKLTKAIEATSRILNEKSVSFLDMQSLVGFLSFCSQAVRLGRVFMRRLWDFVNHYPRSSPKTARRKILAWVRGDLEWWNKLLTTYNGVLFFDTSSR